MEPKQPPSPAPNRWKATTCVYGAAVLLIIAILAWHMALWRADFRVPFYALRGDTTSIAMAVKGVVDNGWFLYNPYVGAPSGLYLADYPMADGFNFLLIRILALFSSHFGVVLNLFFLLQFVLITLTALYVLRSYNISPFVAVPVSILYSLLPAHFGRGESHLMLGAYYMVPLAVMVSLRVCAGEDIFVLRRHPWQFRWRSADGVISLLIFAILGSCGIYYAVFCSFVMIVAAAISFGRFRSYEKVISPATLLLVTLCSLAGNALPTLITVLRYGANPAVSRGSGDGEVYALRIGQLLLPMSWHRIPAFHALRAEYGSILGKWSNENDLASLGIIGTLGFVMLVLVLFWSPATSKGHLLRSLGLLNVACVLLATASGFGPLLVYLLFPAIRAYNRISVVIAFFSLFAIAIALEQLRERFGLRPTYQAVIGAVVLLVGVADQTSATSFQDYAANTRDFYGIEAFVSRIEQSEPPNSMIFELPYVPYPESAPVYRMADYDLFAGYLHSHSLRWSYGTMKGRQGDTLEMSLVEMPPERLANNLSVAGFAGLYIDRFGYPDGAAQLETELSQVLASKPITASDGRRIFFDLRHYASALRGSMTPDMWARKKEALLHPAISADTVHPTDTSGVGLTYTWGAAISFGEESAAQLPLLFGDGWAPPFQDFRWTMGRSASLHFSVEPTHTDKILAFSIHRFLPYTTFPVNVSVDGIPAGTVNAAGAGDYSLRLPGQALEGKRNFVIRLDTPLAKSPKELGVSGDTRVLGLAVRYVVIR